MTNKKWYQKPEMIVAMSALVMTLVATTVSVYSAYIDRSYARASVWPRLQIFKSYGNTHFSHVVSNLGNGPAIIKYAKVEYKSEPILEWKDIPGIPKGFVQSHMGQIILSAQETRAPIAYKGTELNVEKLLKINNSLRIELCYCSIYNECWVMDRSNEPRSVSECIIDPKKAFRQ